MNAGDASAFDGLYHRYRTRVLRLAFRFTGSDDDALDVLQETFTYFFRKFPGFALTSSMTTFLFPVVRNLALQAKRRSLRLQPQEQLDELPGFVTLDVGLLRSELSQAMQNLPAQQRETLLLRFVDDLSIEEIATALNVPEGTVKSRLHHAIAALREDPRARRYFEK